MDIQSGNFFHGSVIEDDFMGGKCSTRPHNYPKLENKQVLNLPPVPHKRFNKIYDRTHHKNNMVFGDGSDWSTFPVMKLTKFGWGCDYDGVAMYGDCGNDASLNITDAITVDVCIEPNTGYGETAPRIIDHGNGNHLYIYITSSTGRLTGYLKINGNAATCFLNPVLPENEWTYIALTFDGTIRRGFINGTTNKEAIDITGNIDSTSANFYIGDDGTQNRVFNGTIGEVRICSSELSEAKCKDNHWRYN